MEAFSQKKDIKEEEEDDCSMTILTCSKTWINHWNRDCMVIPGRVLARCIGKKKTEKQLKEVHEVTCETEDTIRLS